MQRANLGHPNAPASCENWFGRKSSGRIILDFYTPFLPWGMFRFRSDRPTTKLADMWVSKLVSFDNLAVRCGESRTFSNGRCAGANRCLAVSWSISKCVFDESENHSAGRRETRKLGNERRLCESKCKLIEEFSSSWQLWLRMPGKRGRKPCKHTFSSINNRYLLAMGTKISRRINRFIFENS